MFFSFLIFKCSNKLTFIFIQYNLRVPRLFPPVRQLDKRYLLNNPFPLNLNAHSAILTCNAMCQGFILSLSCSHSDTGIHCTVCGVSSPLGATLACVEAAPWQALAGMLVMPRASCPACALRVTDSFMLQPQFHQPRKKPFLLHLSKNILELPWCSRGQDSMLQIQGTQVCSLVGD